MNGYPLLDAWALTISSSWTCLFCSSWINVLNSFEQTFSYSITRKDYLPHLFLIMDLIGHKWVFTYWVNERWSWFELNLTKLIYFWPICFLRVFLSFHRMYYYSKIMNKWTLSPNRWLITSNGHWNAKNIKLISQFCMNGPSSYTKWSFMTYNLWVLGMWWSFPHYRQSFMTFATHKITYFSNPNVLYSNFYINNCN